ncbi:MAG: hypothetical protein JNM43_14520 [Planctomycetaceae bacterium]|nr:hypothetical protein [Planctomycetaceae bacterium]
MSPSWAFTGRLTPFRYESLTTVTRIRDTLRAMAQDARRMRGQAYCYV